MLTLVGSSNDVALLAASTVVFLYLTARLGFELFRWRLGRRAWRY
jgi:hypothetical protein